MNVSYEVHEIWSHLEPEVFVFSSKEKAEQRAAWLRENGVPKVRIVKVRT